MITEKRKNRGYKTTDKVYGQAMKQAKKDKYPLSQIIEEAIRYYGQNSYWPSWMDIEEGIRFNNS